MATCVGLDHIHRSFIITTVARVHRIDYQADRAVREIFESRWLAPHFLEAVCQYTLPMLRVQDRILADETKLAWRISILGEIIEQIQ